jgi:ubiquinone/menaquinone biosynthesis C-methylase UbiE
LLDVGCGTGRFAVFAADRLGGRVWGIDPSEDMLARARAQPGARAVGWRRASAESLPFRSGWFDAAHAQLVAHVLSDRRTALAEVRRVLAPHGRLVLVTFLPEHFEQFHLLRWFPSIRDIDLARFPTPAELTSQLAEVGFGAVEQEPFPQQVEIEPDALLERVRERYISTLHLLDEAEYRSGLAAMERDLAGRTSPVEGRLEWCLITASVTSRRHG